MDLRRLQTNIKDNKRQIIEQSGYVDERCDEVSAKCEELNTTFTAECKSIRSTVSTNNTTLTNNINYISLLPTSGYTNVSLTTSTASKTTYIAPYNGYFFVSIQNGNSTNAFYLENSSSSNISNGVGVSAYEIVLLFVPCKKGDKIIYFRTNPPSTIWWAKFIKGAQV